MESDAAVGGYSTELAANTGAGNDPTLASYRSEDPHISTANFKLLRANANYLGGFSGGWLWGVRGQFQYSPDALISGEQSRLGGVFSIRGTGERPISGDCGVSAQHRPANRKP